MASDVGLELLTERRDEAGAKRALAAAGYGGERVVLMAASDLPSLKALGDVAADALARAGFNVDYQVTDWGSVVQRRAKKEPIAQGGWNVFCTFWAGLDQANPAVSSFLRGTGGDAAVGWPTSERIEALRGAWLDAPDLPAQRRLAGEIQAQAFVDLPYVPLGQYYNQTSFQPSVTGVLDGVPVFWNVGKG